MDCWDCGRGLRPGAPICPFCGARQTDDELGGNAPAPAEAPARGNRATGRPESAWGREPEERRAQDARLPNAPSPKPPLIRPPDPLDPEATTPRGERLPSRLPSRPIERDRDGRDPFDDPRAPRALRRERESAPANDNRGQVSYSAGGGYSSGAGNRYDESAEQPAPRSSGGQYPVPREGRSQWAGPDDPWSDPRGGRAGDARDRGGYGTAQGYSRDQYAPPAPPPNWRDDSAGYSAEYSAEYGARQGGWTDERTVGGYRGQDQGGRRDPRDGRGGYPDDGYRGYDGGERARYAGAPVADSWAGPAVGGGYWEPSEEAPAVRARRGDARRGSRSANRGSGRASARRAARRGGSPALVIALVAVILAVLVGGAALKFAGVLGGGKGLAGCPPTAAAQALAPAATPSQYKAYTSPTSGFTISYPQQWVQKSETATSATGDYVDRFSTADAKSSLAVEQAGGFAAECDAQIIDSEVTGGQQDGSTFIRTTSPAATMSIGGATWQRRDYDVTLKAGDKVHMAILSAHHAGKGYAIVMYSAPDTFAADERATFSAMLKTFHFAG